MVCLSAILTSCREFKTQAARLVVMHGKFCHITPVIRQLHCLPVSFRINFKILLLTFKAIQELTPSYINDLVKIKPLNSRYRLWSNDGILLSHLNFKTLTTLGNRAFVATAPKFWNDLHLEIRMTKSVDTFKKFLKTHLFCRLFILSKVYLIPIHDNVIFTYF